MDAVVQKGDYSCRPLKQEEWAIYREIRMATLSEAGAMNRLKEESSEGKDYWEQEVSSSCSQAFGLFHKKEIIGSALILFKKEKDAAPSGDTIGFSGAYILTEHRGLGLGSLLHQSRIAYAVGGHWKTAATKILEGNETSRRAAERQGFLCTGSVVEDEAVYRTYTLDLQSLRSANVKKDVGPYKVTTSFITP